MLQDEAGVLQHGDVVEWIAFDGDQVRKQACFHLAPVVAMASGCGDRVSGRNDVRPDGIAARDGLQLFGVWNDLNLSLGTTQAMYACGRLDDVPVVPGDSAPPPMEEPVGVGCCSASGGPGGIDPTLWLLMVIGAGTIVLRRAPRRH